MKTKGHIKNIINMDNYGVDNNYYIEIKTENKYIAVYKNDIKDIYINQPICLSYAAGKAIICYYTKGFENRIVCNPLTFLTSQDFLILKEKTMVEKKAI
jgi:hypothetical protein